MALTRHLNVCVLREALWYHFFDVDGYFSSHDSRNTEVTTHGRHQSHQMTLGFQPPLSQLAPASQTTIQVNQRVLGTQAACGPQVSPSSHGRVACPSWLNERRTVFGRRGSRGKTKKVKISMWEHEFICLAYTDQTNPPSPMDKAELIRAGLGPRKLSLFEFGSSGEFYDTIIGAFPKLVEGGGFDLLRTVPNNNKELCVIPPPIGGHTVDYIKNIVSQAKVYVRPIQKNLSLDMLLDPDKEVVCIHNL